VDEPRELDPERDARQWLRPVPELLEPPDDVEEQHALVVARWQRWLSAA
jgi:hypothetical protein